MILYMENPEDSGKKKKSLVLVNEFRKVVASKINSSISRRWQWIFWKRKKIHLLDNSIKNKKIFTDKFKEAKDLYSENFKTLMKETE